MLKNHIFDSYLKETSGNAEDDGRIMGNSLFEDTKRRAREWEQELERYLPTQSDIDELPNGSWLIQFKYKLVKPFTSKGESEFHHYEGQNGCEIHNPIVRDHLIGLPLVQPTIWKGHLRFAAGIGGINENIADRLFGSRRGDEVGQTGRLHFFPTFFLGGTKLEVITPLYRDTHTPVRGPLYVEVIPRSSVGVFSLLYIPWPRGNDWNVGQVAEDLRETAKAVEIMLLDYGFSAKKASGWGVVQDQLENGFLSAKGPIWPELLSSDRLLVTHSFKKPEEFFVRFMDKTGNPKPNLRINNRFLSNNEYDLLSEKPGSKTEYRRFRSWYEEHGANWRHLQDCETHSAPLCQTYSVESVTAFVGLVNQLAELLGKDISNE